MQCYSSIYYPFFYVLRVHGFPIFLPCPILAFQCTGCRSYYLWTWLYTDWNGIFYPSSLGDKTTSGSQYVVGQEEALWDHLTGINIKVLPSIFSPVFHAASLLLQTRPQKMPLIFYMQLLLPHLSWDGGRRERVCLSKIQFMWVLCAVHEFFFSYWDFTFFW